MKRLVETDEATGFEAMLGEKVVLFCGVLIYTGVLSGVNEDHVELTDAQIAYETGHLTKGAWLNAEAVAGTWRIMKLGIESWGAAKC